MKPRNVVPWHTSSCSGSLTGIPSSPESVRTTKSILFTVKISFAYHLLRIIPTGPPSITFIQVPSIIRVISSAIFFLCASSLFVPTFLFISMILRYIFFIPPPRAPACNERQVGDQRISKYDNSITFFIRISNRSAVKI
ncbi:hypothetical protein Leryth_016689 [Lithospermum erythrorhizon]|nr:hypothetical protein Leryth_016689 [Lithospermum erythrorhizon]